MTTIVLLRGRMAAVEPILAFRVQDAVLDGESCCFDFAGSVFLKPPEYAHQTLFCPALDLRRI